MFWLTCTMGMPIISRSSMQSAFCCLVTRTWRLLYLNPSSYRKRTGKHAVCVSSLRSDG